MGILGAMLRNLEAGYGEKWIGKGEPTGPYVEEIIRRAGNNVLMVTGELDPHLYERSSLPQVIKEAIQRGVQFSFVFHKQGRSIEEAKETFLKENKTIADLAREYPDKVNLYWKETRPKGHYVVGDGDNVLMEDRHEPRMPRRAIVKLDHSITLGKKLEERFYSFISRPDCHKLSVA